MFFEILFIYIQQKSKKNLSKKKETILKKI